jgi:hypothetical protein
MMATTDPPTTDPPRTAAGPSPLPSWHPLSDRGRWLKVLALAAVLAGGFTHFAWLTDRLTVDVSEMDLEPEAYLGEPVMLGNFKVTAVRDGCADLWSPWAEVSACPIPEDLRVGHPVSLTATYRGRGRVDAVQWRIHRQLKVKKAIGLSALLGVLGLVGWDLRRRNRA